MFFFSFYFLLEATAEHDLSSLLRELEVVEEKMKELEQENNQFTRVRNNILCLALSFLDSYLVIECYMNKCQTIIKNQDILLVIIEYLISLGTSIYCSFKIHFINLFVVQSVDRQITKPKLILH